MLKVFDLGTRYFIIAGKEDDNTIPEGLLPYDLWLASRYHQSALYMLEAFEYYP